jgi:hypothetical protein
MRSSNINPRVFGQSESDLRLKSTHAAPVAGRKASFAHISGVKRLRLIGRR